MARLHPEERTQSPTTWHGPDVIRGGGAGGAGEAGGKGGVGGDGGKFEGSLKLREAPPLSGSVTLEAAAASAID